VTWAEARLLIAEAKGQPVAVGFIKEEIAIVRLLLESQFIMLYFPM
jgi:hypothetical protein